MAAKLGLRPWEFGRLTIAQFRVMVDGYVDRIQDWEHDMAHFTAAIVNVWLRRKVTADQILGKPRIAPPSEPRRSRRPKE